MRRNPGGQQRGRFSERFALDLLDGALEWRAAGRSPVAALDLVQRLLAAEPGNAAWLGAASRFRVKLPLLQWVEDNGEQRPWHVSGA